MEGSVARGLRDFCSLPCDSLVGRTSSRENHLDKIFKFFVLSVLATGLGDLLTTWINHENHVFCSYKSVFPSNISDCSLSSPFQTSLKLSVSPSMNLHFLHLLIFKSPRKWYEFLYPRFIFHVFSLVFLILWDIVGVFEFYGFRTWVCSFCWLWGFRFYWFWL